VREEVDVQDSGWGGEVLEDVAVWELVVLVVGGWWALIWSDADEFLYQTYTLLPSMRTSTKLPLRCCVLLGS
jgi:hypothetical protein